MTRFNEERGYRRTLERLALSTLAVLGLTASPYLPAAHATGDPEGDRPSFRLSDLGGGRSLIEWSSRTNWEDVADPAGDVLVLTVPEPAGDFTNAIVLESGADVDAVLDEILGEETDRRGGPLLRIPLSDGVVYGDGTVFLPPTGRGPTPLRDDETRERTKKEPANDAGETETRSENRAGDVAGGGKPPKIFGEEIDDEETLDVAYKFFAGDTKPAKAEARIKAARKYYEKAFAWWEQEINDKCEFDVLVQDLGDDTETLTHTVALAGKKRRQAKRQGKPLTRKVGYSRYTSEAQWAKAPKETWLTGPAERDRLLRSPSPGNRFHLAIFKVKGIAFRDGGKKRNVEHVLFKPAIGILRRPVQDKQNTATHEVGHFFGLKDGDGALMTYAPKAKRRGGSLYGPKKFLKRWCDVIEQNIRGPK